MTTTPITSLRYDEDYSAYRHADHRQGAWWTPPIVLPLDQRDPTGAYATLGLEARARYEWLDNDNFGDGPQDNDGLLLTRVIPTLSVHASLDPTAETGAPEVRGFLQLISANEIGSSTPPSPVNENRGDVLQAFFEFNTPLEAGDGRLALRAGRRSLRLGSERLVGTRYGVNVPRAFDGFYGTLELDNSSIEAFWARPVHNDPDPWDDTSNDAQSLWGVYTSHNLERHLPGAGLDVYYLGFLDDASVFAQNPGDPQREIRHTFGTRFFGEAAIDDVAWSPVVDWNLEAFLQAGRFGGANVFAWSVAADVGLTFDAPNAPRLGLKANVISGDDDPNDPDLQSFNPLFPRGTYFGELSPIGPYNLMNLQGSLALRPTDAWVLTMQGGPFFRHSTDDGVYDIAGNVIRGPSPTSDAREIGWQWELLVEGSLAPNLDLLVSYGQFHPGDFIEATGPSEVIRLAAIELRYRF